MVLPATEVLNVPVWSGVCPSDDMEILLFSVKLTLFSYLSDG